MLVCGLSAVRRGHGAAFGPRHADTLVGVLLRLAAAAPGAAGDAGSLAPHGAEHDAAAAVAAPTGDGSAAESVSPVQLAAFEVVENLDFCDGDGDGWTALLGRLLSLLAGGPAAAAAAPSPSDGGVAPPSPAVAADAGSVPGVAPSPSPPPPSPALIVRILGILRSVHAVD